MGHDDDAPAPIQPRSVYTREDCTVTVGSSPGLLVLGFYGEREVAVLTSFLMAMRRWNPQHDGRGWYLSRAAETELRGWLNATVAQPAITWSVDTLTTAS